MLFRSSASLVTVGIALGCGGRSSLSSPIAEPVPECSGPSSATVIHQGGAIAYLALVDGQALLIDQALLKVPVAGGTTNTLVAGSGFSGLVATSDRAFFTARRPVGPMTPGG